MSKPFEEVATIENLQRLFNSLRRSKVLTGAENPFIYVINKENAEEILTILESLAFTKKAVTPISYEVYIGKHETFTASLNQGGLRHTTQIAGPATFTIKRDEVKS